MPFIVHVVGLKQVPSLPYIPTCVYVYRYFELDDFVIQSLSRLHTTTLTYV